jgi:hypothetical protein
MGYILTYFIWLMVGVLVSVFMGANARRRAYHPNADGTMLAGAFGGLIGGVIGDGLPHALAGKLTLMSVVSAVIGGAIFCWAARGRVSDIEP